MTEKVSLEKELVLRAYGAEVVRTPKDVDHTHPDYYHNVAKRLAKEKKAYMPNQFDNQANPLAYFQSAGPEIWHDSDGKVTHFVATMGTGGSLTGTARYLKKKNKKIKIIGVDPAGSLLHNFFFKTEGKEAPYLVEGPGREVLSGALDLSILDDVVVVSDKESFVTARSLVEKEGIFAGGSSGMAVYAGLKIAKKLPKDAVVVILLPDSGRGYLSTFYDDAWMKKHKLL